MAQKSYSGKLFLSIVLLFSYSACLSYPAKIDYGSPYGGDSNQESAAQLKEIPGRNLNPYSQSADNSMDTNTSQGHLISSKFVLELSHEQMRKLDPKGAYATYRRYPVQVFRLLYRSKNYTPLSGLVLVPMGLDIKAYPVYQYQHSTLLPFPMVKHGAYEAPSFFGTKYRRGRKMAAVVRYGLTVASSGYLTVMPDFMGYGIQAHNEHPFMIGPELAQEAIDMLLAVQEWAQQRSLRLDGKLFLAGVSEGAYSGLWTQRLLSESPLPGLRLRAGTFYAGPYNISGLLGQIAFSERDVDPLFNWGVYSTWRTYLQESWPKEQVWRKKIRNIRNILLIPTQPKEKLFQPEFRDYLRAENSNFWELAEGLNAHKNWQSDAPIYLYHNIEDSLIPSEQSRDAELELKKAGNTVSLTWFAGSGHAISGSQFLADMLVRFAEAQMGED